jgi:parallel beta-helix repeat protein
MKKSFNYDLTITFIICFTLSSIIIPSIKGISTVSIQNYNDGKTLYVGGVGPGNYSDIQEAVNNAENGDIIFVYSGEYPANIIIDKSIFLIGENRETTIIQGKRDGIFVFADRVTITNFTITQCGGFWDKSGLYIGSDDNTIYNNNIVNNGVLNGIYMEFASFNNVYNNLVENCQYNGIKLAYSNYNNISGNFISENRGMGMILHDSSYNNIYQNTISKSFWGGINIYENCDDNLLYHNNLIENEIDNAYDISANIWDNGKEGNYWDDYIGEDNNGDGIGDTPYIISGNTTKDNFPIMDICEIPSKPSIDGPVNGKPGEEYDYTFSVEDSDGDEFFIFVDWGDGTNPNWIGPFESGTDVILKHSWAEKGTYIISARAKDAKGFYGFTNIKEISRPLAVTNFNLIFKLIFEGIQMLEKISSIYF